MPLGHIRTQAKYVRRAIGQRSGLADNMSMRQKHFIKEWRKFRGLTQIQLAERIGMNQGNLSKIESGTRQYDQEFLELAADALRCEVPDLLVRDPTGPEAIWSIWEQLDAPARLQVVEIAKTFKKVS